MAIANKDVGIRLDGRKNAILVFETYFYFAETFPRLFPVKNYEMLSLVVSTFGVQLLTGYIFYFLFLLLAHKIY